MSEARIGELEEQIHKSAGKRRNHRKRTRTRVSCLATTSTPETMVQVAPKRTLLTERMRSTMKTRSTQKKTLGLRHRRVTT